MKPVYDPVVAITALSKTDPILAKLMQQAGPCKLLTRERFDPFQALLRSIIYQQLSGKAAATIHGRVEALFTDGKPTPEALAVVSDDDLRNAGMSRAKVVAAKDLAAKIMAGAVPSARQLKRMDDEAIIETLIQVRGIGRWTVEMLLMFHLQRPDVLPVADLGVRKGFMLAYGKNELPDAKELTEHGETWRPYRSVASWYLWRALEL